MDELPVIGSLCSRKDFWDRHGANIASVSRSKKNHYGERSSLFRRCAIRIALGYADTREALVLFEQPRDMR